jgi:DNA-binding protein H-NS
MNLATLSAVQLAALRQNIKTILEAKIRTRIAELERISNAPSALAKPPEFYRTMERMTATFQPTPIRRVAPKFRHPRTGATWAGRGLKPRWLVAEMKRGKAMDQFKIRA